MRHKVRICLAGRAAEQLILGAEEVSCHGANDDLQNATKLCGEMFAVCGMSPHMEDEESAGNNLMVLTAEASLSDHIRVDKYVSAYLEKQYKIVLDQLRSHHTLLDHIINELTSKKLLNQEELIEICAGYQLNASK